MAASWLNLNKSGFCVRAAKDLETDHLPVVRFQLPDARDFVESSRPDRLEKSFEKNCWRPFRRFIRRSAISDRAMD